MKFDCTAFVSVGGKTLLTRTAHLERTRLLLEKTALEAVHEEAIYVLRSFTDHLGNEVAVEIITPAALAETGTWARVEYWRPTGGRPLFPKFTEGQLLVRADYALAGVIITPADKALKHAYDYTESPFLRWNPNLEAGKSPTVQVGDLFVVTSPELPVPTAYGVSGIGFTKVIFPAG
jgi:hypothetical protein